MADETPTIANRVSQKLKRAFELMFMLCAAFFGLFFYQKAKIEHEKNEQLHHEIRRVTRQNHNPEKGDHCSICLCSPLEILVNPCGHICLCEKCSENLAEIDPKCPICRQKITNTQRVYLSWTFTYWLSRINMPGFYTFVYSSQVKKEIWRSFMPGMKEDD